MSNLFKATDLIASSHKSKFFLYSSATCSELPYNISTIYQTVLQELFNIYLINALTYNS